MLYTNITNFIATAIKRNAIISIYYLEIGFCDIFTKDSKLMKEGCLTPKFHSQDFILLLHLSDSFFDAKEI